MCTPQAGTYTASVTVTSSFRHDHHAAPGTSPSSAPRPRSRRCRPTAVWWATTPVDEYRVRPFGGRPGGGHLGRRELAAGRRPRAAVRGRLDRRAQLPGPGGAGRDDAARVLPRRGRVARADLSRHVRLGHAGPARPARRGRQHRGDDDDGRRPRGVLRGLRWASWPSRASSPAGGRPSTLVPDSPALRPASLALADTARGAVLFGAGPAGTIRSVSADGGTWASRGIPAKTAGPASRWPR